MASLKNRRGVWYARVQWWNESYRKEKQISLKTESKVTARERLAEVNKVEDDIKEGMNFSFSWLSESTTTKVQRYILNDAVEKWLSQRNAEGIRQSTIKRNRYSMKSFMFFVGTSAPLSKVSTSMIDSYRNYCIQKKMKPDGININLRAIKTFLRWCYRRELISKTPFVDMVLKPKELPLYIPDRIYDKLMQLEWLNDQYKTAFCFYRDTGCRRSEPFLGELHGNWLLIGGDETKQRMDKELSLNHINLERLTKMKTVFEAYKGTLESWIGNLSKTFLKAIREIDGKETKYHLHCLRHTFAVRRYLQTRDIYRVKQELGHASVVTTEIYAKFSLRRLEMDFPSLVNSSKINENWERGHIFRGHTKSDFPVNTTINSVSDKWQ